MSTVVNSRAEVTFVLLFFVALTVAGVIGGGFFVRDYARARASNAWPTANGVVLSQLDQDVYSLRYAYTYGGRSYQSGRERVFSAGLLRGPGARYRAGEKVLVYVDPGDPSFSVLLPGGAAPSFVVFTVIAGLFIFIGIGGVIWTFSEGVDPEEFAEPMETLEL